MVYRIKNRVEFREIGKTKFAGFEEKYMERFFENRIFSDFAKNEIYKEAEDALRFPHDDDTAVGHWSGEFWGKLVISACRVYKYTGREDLKAFIENAALKVISFAREDGYINSYKDSRNVFPPDPKAAFEIMGWDCDWNWNIWCRKYTLWGLVEAAELTGSKKILGGAHCLANQLISELSELGVHISETGTKNFCGLPSGSIIKPMLILYRLTGDEKLLDFCVDIAENWDRDDGKKPNIIRNALMKKPVHEWYPKSNLWAKAYEMMSCLDGLLELYRITGTEKYFTAVCNMYELLKEHELNPMSSVGFNDIFANAAKIENALSEPCDVIHWIRVCSELYRLTGDAKYINSIEKAYYNAFLASVSDDGKWGARAVRASCSHMIASGQSGLKYNQCCLDNIPRGYINITELAVSVSERGVYINMYSPLKTKLENAVIEISGGYIESGRASIEITTEKPIDIFLRVPDTAGKNAAVNGEKISGDYYKLTVGRGVSEITADFDFKAEIHDFPVAPGKISEDDFKVQRWIPYGKPGVTVPAEYMEKKMRSYITYGPILLAKSKKTGMAEAEIFCQDTVCGENVRAEAVYRGTADNMMAEYDVEITGNGECRKIAMCAYATADDYESGDMRFFSIYI